MRTSSSETIVINSPMGHLAITACEHQLVGCYWTCDPLTEAPTFPLLQQASDQLMEYFAGVRQTFNLPLAPAGSAFQQAVWQTLQAIPYGATKSYQQLAQAIGRPTAFRAVGNANGQNPISILIPCHRVIRANGALGGYAGGLNKKTQLLSLEGYQPTVA